VAVTTPHLAFPVRVRAGRFLAVEQDSRRHLEDRAEVLLRTRLGTLDATPDLGLRDLVARVGPASPEVLRVVSEHVSAQFTATEDESRLAERVRGVAAALAQDEERET
jgi:hypothetical protein